MKPLIMFLAFALCALLSTSCSEQNLDITALDLTGKWQLHFEPPLMSKMSGGVHVNADPPPHPRELRIEVTMKKNQGGLLLGSFGWQEDDTLGMVQIYPNVQNNQLKIGFQSLEFVGTARDNDTIAGQVSLAPGESAPASIFKEVVQRGFTLKRISNQTDNPFGRLAD